MIFSGMSYVGETESSDSFLHLSNTQYELPIDQHVGAFGVKRTHHIHEGVDLYAPHETPVLSLTNGKVIKVYPFTGTIAGYPHWLDTYAIAIETDIGVMVYGEVTSRVSVGDLVSVGQVIGNVCRVLRHDKGRPTSMLHFELWSSEPHSVTWVNEIPKGLLDPTNSLKRLLTNLEV
jgi:murein DD-endopeptidase MepM/ murein hydrolase activator NlpD